MSNEKRLVLFLVLTFLSIWGIQFLMDVTGLNPPLPKKPQQPIAQANPPADAKAVPKPTGPAAPETPGPEAAVIKKGDGKDQEKGPAVEPPKARPEKVAPVKPEELVLGSATDRSPDGYRLEVQLEQKGAGVASVASSRFEAEHVGGAMRHLPLQLLRPDPTAPPSLALALLTPRKERGSPASEAAEAGTTAVPEAPEDGNKADEFPDKTDEILWEVERDEQGRVVRPISKTPPGAKGPVEGQRVVFRTRVEPLGVELTKTFTLFKGEDGFDVTLEFRSPERDQALSYTLLGPHGIPIEGEWYTGTFRDAFFGQVDGNKTKVVTRSAQEIVKAQQSPETFTSLPLKYAGIENQYFAVLVEPYPKPKTPESRWDSQTVGTVIHPPDPQFTQKADIGVEITSKPIAIGPNRPEVYTYRVFAGPKTTDALTPFGAVELASYRKSGRFGIPYAPEVAAIISPLLDRIYGLTAWVARGFGGSKGNYGVAIILLTLLVRMLMFPLGRKQAMAAKKMQELQPLLKEIQEKYKNDREKQGRETMALYKKHGVNPLGGCLPALIQLPIFVGLWQALNTSVNLRQAPFLYIRDLAAPDMLFKFPYGFEVPWLGWRYFNLLPFLVVTLMLVQTKLFSPPATTPEAETQQKMMKYMMIFMAFMFYKVPSGLGIYFITSSLWQIGERLLLPKVTHATIPPGASGDAGSPPGGGRGGKGGPDGDGAPSKPPGKLAQLWERVKEEAAKDPTIRNMGLDKDQNKDRDRGKGKPRARPGRRG